MLYVTLENKQQEIIAAVPAVILAGIFVTMIAFFAFILLPSTG